MRFGDNLLDALIGEGDDSFECADLTTTPPGCSTGTPVSAFWLGVTCSGQGRLS